MNRHRPNPLRKNPSPAVTRRSIITWHRDQNCNVQLMCNLPKDTVEVAINAVTVEGHIRTKVTPWNTYTSYREWKNGHRPNRTAQSNIWRFGREYRNVWGHQYIPRNERGWNNPTNHKKSSRRGPQTYIRRNIYDDEFWKHQRQEFQAKHNIPNEDSSAADMDMDKDDTEEPDTEIPPEMKSDYASPKIGPIMGSRMSLRKAMFSKAVNVHTEGRPPYETMEGTIMDNTQLSDIDAQDTGYNEDRKTDTITEIKEVTVDELTQKVRRKLDSAIARKKEDEKDRRRLKELAEVNPNARAVLDNIKKQRKARRQQRKEARKLTKLYTNGSYDTDEDYGQMGQYSPTQPPEPDYPAPSPPPLSQEPDSPPNLEPPSTTESDVVKTSPLLVALLKEDPECTSAQKNASANRSPLLETLMKEDTTYKVEPEVKKEIEAEPHIKRDTPPASPTDPWQQPVKEDSLIRLLTQSPWQLRPEKTAPPTEKNQYVPASPVYHPPSDEEKDFSDEGFVSPRQLSQSSTEQCACLGGFANPNYTGPDNLNEPKKDEFEDTLKNIKLEVTTPEQPTSPELPKRKTQELDTAGHKWRMRQFFTNVQQNPLQKIEGLVKQASKPENNLQEKLRLVYGPPKFPVNVTIFDAKTGKPFNVKGQVQNIKDVAATAEAFKAIRPVAKMRTGRAPTPTPLYQRRGVHPPNLLDVPIVRQRTNSDSILMPPPQMVPLNLSKKSQ